MRFGRSQGGNRRPNRRGWLRVIRVLGESFGYSPLLRAGGLAIWYLWSKGTSTHLHGKANRDRRRSLHGHGCLQKHISFGFGVSSAVNGGRSRTSKLYAQAELCSGIQVTASSHSAQGCLASRDCEADLLHSLCNDHEVQRLTRSHSPPYGRDAQAI